MVFLLFPRRPLLIHVETFQNFNYRGEIPAIGQSSFFHRLLNLSGPWERFGNVAMFFLVYLAIKLQFHRLGSGATLLATCSCSAVVESVQFFIPGRVSSLTDFALNSLGASVAFLISHFGPKFFDSRRSL